MNTNLNELRKIAEAATPGPWEIDGPAHPGPDDTLPLHNNDGGAIAYVQPLWDDAEFIARFDPPTVLALLSRLEQAEQAVQRVREALGNHPRTCDQHTEDDPVKCGWKLAVIDVQNALDGDGRE